MSRTEAREQAFIFTFEKLFNPELSYDEMSTLASQSFIFTPDNYTKLLYEKTQENTEKADEIINRLSRGWKTNRLSKVTLSLLRIAITEIMCFDDVPDSVSANEAVEFAKKYASVQDAQFINGILGSVIRGKEEK